MGGLRGPALSRKWPHYIPDRMDYVLQKQNLQVDRIGCEAKDRGKRRPKPQTGKRGRQDVGRPTVKVWGCQMAASLEKHMKKSQERLKVNIVKLKKIECEADAG